MVVAADTSVAQSTMRLLAVLLGVCLTAFTFAQQTIWSHTVEDTSKPQVTRDAADNLYLATRR